MGLGLGLPLGLGLRVGLGLGSGLEFSAPGVGHGGEVLPHIGFGLGFRLGLGLGLVLQLGIKAIPLHRASVGSQATIPVFFGRTPAG